MLQVAPNYSAVLLGMTAVILTPAVRRGSVSPSPAVILTTNAVEMKLESRLVMERRPSSVESTIYKVVEEK